MLKKILIAALLFISGPVYAQTAAPDISATRISVTASSGNVAAGTATATLPATQGRFTYICGFSITSSGSTGALVVSPTVTNVIGGTMTYTYTSVAGVTLANAPLEVTFTPCIPSTAVNTTIPVSMPTLGAGNTNATVSAWGYQWNLSQ
jgi:hypothetical protein